MHKHDHDNDPSDVTKAYQGLFEPINDLMSEGVNPGMIAVALATQAVHLSYACCDDPSAIFTNILRALSEAVPQKSSKDEPVKEEDMQKLLTHSFDQKLLH